MSSTMSYAGWLPWPPKLLIAALCLIEVSIYCRLVLLSECFFTVSVIFLVVDGLVGSFVIIEIDMDHIGPSYTRSSVRDVGVTLRSCGLLVRVTHRRFRTLNLFHSGDILDGSKGDESKRATGAIH